MSTTVWYYYIITYGCSIYL